MGGFLVFFLALVAAVEVAKSLQLSGFNIRLPVRLAATKNTNNNPSITLPASPSQPENASTDYHLRFGAVGRLYASETTSSTTILERLTAATVIVVGLGGVGSWAAEALGRSGVGHLVLVDLDDICISNMNRQIHALSDTVGQWKMDVLRDRIQNIHPNCRMDTVHDFVDPNTVARLLDPYTASNSRRERGCNSNVYIIDAIDNARDKAALVAYAVARRIPIVTCGAAAGLQNPMAVSQLDLSRIEGDKLLAATRRDLRKWHGFPVGLSLSQQKVLRKRVQKWNIVGVASTERPSSSNDTVSRSPCDSGMGTACFVTGTFGFVAASIVVEQIAHQKPQVPRMFPGVHARAGISTSDEEETKSESQQ